MDKFITGLAGVLVGAIAILGFVALKPSPTPPAGSTSGPDVFSFTHFYDNVNVGGTDFATSSVGAVTYTAASLAKTRVIEHQAASAVTATLPTNAAWSGVGFLPNVGDTQTIFIHASTTAVTLAGNTGVTLASASSTLKVAAGSIGRLECTRLGATEARLIECLLTAD